MRRRSPEGAGERMDMADCVIDLVTSKNSARNETLGS